MLKINSINLHMYFNLKKFLNNNFQLINKLKKTTNGKILNEESKNKWTVLSFSRG